MPPTRPVLERFLEKFYVDPVTKCWIWTAGKTQDGYGHMDFGTRKTGRTTRLAHAVAYELFIGPIPKGLSHDHLCRNVGCVNPWHIDPVPIKENILRGFGPTAINNRKTHCIHGHPFEGRNLMLRKNGNRDCRACHNRQGRINKVKYRHTS